MAKLPSYALVAALGLHQASAGWNVCVAKTPPMGYNTWNFWGCGVNETILQQTALAMHNNGLQSAGYVHVNSDDCWMLAERDANGNQVPNPAKFPSGLNVTVAYINSLGLIAGLYTARGQHTCAGFAASCGHEAQDAANYAAWGLGYIKDDDCGGCTDYLTDYGRMQQGLWAAGRPLVLSVEGDPDVHVITYGGYGNMKRVGHDITPEWRSMLSLVDIGSGLWPFAHNCSNVSVGGWWNDLDMLEVGNGDFSPLNAGAEGLLMAQTHFTMWCIMKAPLLMGNDMLTIDATTLSVLTNAEALAVSQDAWGVQAHRVASITPANNTVMPNSFDNVATVALCNASSPTQTWMLRNQSSGARDLLYLVACAAGDPYQQWTFPGSAGGAASTLQNVGSGQCVDSSAQFDPGMLVTCNASSSSQQWMLQTGSNHTISGSPVHCLDVYDFSGPDVEMGSCKTPGQGDSNQQWVWNEATMQLSSLSSGAFGMCLSASAGPAGSLLYTVDASGAEWCLTGGGSEGQWGVGPCPTGQGQRGSIFTVTPAGSGVYNINGGGSSIAWNNQFGASGPLPHTRYITNGGGQWALNLAAMMNGTGSAVQANSNSIINDDGVGNVTIGGNFCLDVSTMGNLEVWVGPLSGNRFAASLLNRSPGNDSITLTWEMLGVPDATSFAVRDIWAASDRGTFTASYTATVPSHGAAFLVLTPQ